jgi:hypothetical protein
VECERFEAGTEFEFEFETQGGVFPRAPRARCECIALRESLLFWFFRPLLLEEPNFLAIVFMCWHIVDSAVF